MVEFVRLDKSADMTNRTAAKLYIIKNNNSARVKNCNRSTALKIIRPAPETVTA